MGCGGGARGELVREEGGVHTVHELTVSRSLTLFHNLSTYIRFADRAYSARPGLSVCLSGAQVGTVGGQLGDSWRDTWGAIGGQLGNSRGQFGDTWGTIGGQLG